MMKATYTHKGKYKERKQVHSQASSSGGFPSAASEGSAVAEGGGSQSAQCKEERLEAQVEDQRRAKAMLEYALKGSARTQPNTRVSGGVEEAEEASSHSAPSVDDKKWKEYKDNRDGHCSEQRSAVAEGYSWSWDSGDDRWSSWGCKTWCDGVQKNEWESFGWKSH